MTGASVWVVRHGESTWNAAGRMQRQNPHPPLTARGLAQAHATAYSLRDKHIDRIITSDAVRATQTAQAIAAALGVPVSVDIRLRERGRIASGGLEDPHDRVVSALGDIAAAGGRAAIVTHGDIVCLVRDLVGAGDVDSCRWRSGSEVPNGAVLAIRLDGASGRQ